MEFNKLYYFYTVAKYEHVTHAAEHLHIAQPSITKAIKQLEDELGVPLFAKRGRNIYLTAYGKYLQEKLEGVFPMLERIPDELQALKREGSQTVRLNVLAASPIVTRAVIEYKKHHGEAVFRLIQQEEKKESDISVSTGDWGKSEASADGHRSVIEERIYLAVPKSSRFAARKEIDLQEVRDEGFVVLSGFRSFRAICDLFCARAGFKPKIIFESDAPEVVRNIIKTNIGVAFWPEFSWGQISDSSDIVLLPICSPLCRREVIVELYEKPDLSATAKDFYEYLIAYIKSSREGSEI
ncbi:MAG: LysR family transcriptional regulator [Clostridia bacterium]|nr:LysR family transcriptional regulator [Clostridia bacterium]